MYVNSLLIYLPTALTCKLTPKSTTVYYGMLFTYGTPTQVPPRYTKRNKPPTLVQYTNRHISQCVPLNEKG